MLAAVISCVVISVLSAQQSIEGVLRKFDGAISQAAIPKAQVSIGFISYAETDTSGTVVPWMQSEIKKAAAKMRHIDVIQSKMLPPQEQTGIATRGASFGKHRTIAPKDRKYILTGKYYENKTAGVVELTLELSSTSGKLLASETASIPMTEISNRNLMLYPENLAQAEAIKEEFTQAAAEVQNAEPAAANKTPQKAGSPSATAKSGTIDITAVMLDSENNLVDILYPGDTVKFLVSTGTDAYIAIMGIDAAYRLLRSCFVPAANTDFYLRGFNSRRASQTNRRCYLSAQHRFECHTWYDCCCQAEEAGNRYFCYSVHGDEKVICYVGGHITVSPSLQSPPSLNKEI